MPEILNPDSAQARLGATPRHEDDVYIMSEEDRRQIIVAEIEIESNKRREAIRQTEQIMSIIGSDPGSFAGCVLLAVRYFKAWRFDRRVEATLEDKLQIYGMPRTY